MANLLAYGTQIVGGGSSQSGGGHVIVNASGTELAQEDKLQFVGSLKTTDDSSNGKTIVDDSPTEIEWSVWNTMTDAEKEAIPKALVVNAPGIDGPIDVDLITKLWENQNPTATFDAQSITLTSDDYDFLILTYYAHKDDNKMLSVIFNKGENSIITLGSTNGSGSFCGARVIISNSATSFSFDNAAYCIGSAAPVGNNGFLIPVAIYGFKKTITVDVSGIISDVSTSADKCMLSDGVTSVQNTIPQLVATVYGDGIKTFNQLFNELNTALINSGLSLKSNSYLTLSTDIYHIGGHHYFLHHYVTNSVLAIQHVTIGSNSSFYNWENGTISNAGNNVPPNGYSISLYA